MHEDEATVMRDAAEREYAEKSRYAAMNGLGYETPEGLRRGIQTASAIRPNKYAKQQALLHVLSMTQQDITLAEIEEACVLLRNHLGE